ncbi:MAG: GntR family transcriptional regulator [Candidatus Poribacteria bacterium]|nr:GntR family transcriptional regulator [Candidatus Poribacteria bacterium]
MPERSTSMIGDHVSAESSARSRSLLKDRAYSELKDLILREVFPPGSFLSKRRLAERLEMSRTPIQSALERLEAEGFVTISPQQGVVVREFSVHEIVDLFELREALEPFVMRKLASRLTDDHVAALRSNLEKQEVAAQQDDIVASTKFDADFHLLMCEFLDNREILRVMRQQHDKLYRVALRVMSGSSGRAKQSFDEHKAIADALIAGDGGLAAATMLKHLEFGKSFLVSRR